ncbi:MAG TPA: alpha/beta hydrolase [Sporichthya sp.]|nr:alpha/beta hydrolase [Sporichthya sp.]
MSVETRTVSLHADQVRFLQTGGADPARSPDAGLVVLVHGIAGGAATWGPVLAELDRRGEGRRVIAPDLIGHGRADYSLGGYANEIRDLLAALGHRRATIVGHSLGGGIALQFQYQYPELCARLVLVDSGGLGSELHPVLRAVTLPGAEWVLPVLAHAKLVTAGGRFYGAVRRLPLTPRRPSMIHGAAAFGSLSDSVRRRAFVLTARNVIDMAGQRVSGLDKLYLSAGVPTLIVWGGRDAIIPAAHGSAAADALPGSRFELFEQAGHFPHCDEPARFTELLLDFIDTTTPASLSPEDYAARLAAQSAGTSEPG